MIKEGREHMELSKEKYMTVRQAQAQGVRTLDELKQKTDISIDSKEEEMHIEKLLKNACKCKNVSIETIVEAVKNGADTVEKVSEETGAGTVCTRCKGIITNIIENKR